MLYVCVCVCVIVRPSFYFQVGKNPRTCKPPTRTDGLLITVYAITSVDRFRWGDMPVVFPLLFLFPAHNLKMAPPSHRDNPSPSHM